MISFICAEHSQDPNACTREVRSSNIYATSTDMTNIVLRHIYRLPWFDEYSGEQEVTGNDWVSLCQTAQGFEVPSLRKYIKEKLEAHLEDLIEKGLSGSEAAMQQCVELLTEIYETVAGRQTAAVEVIAKLICKHYSGLGRHATFTDMMDDSLGDCAGFFNSMVEYAARDGLWCAN